MRPQGKPATLNELMGSAGSSKPANEFGLEDLPNILGEKMPDMPKNRIGRYRLMNALRLRFGPGYKNIPGVQNVIKQFDSHIATENVVRANKMS